MYEESRRAKVKVIAESIARLEKEYADAKSIESKSNASVVSKLEIALDSLREEYDKDSDHIRAL